MLRKSLMLAAGFMLAANLASAQTAMAPAGGMAAPVAALPIPVVPIGNHYVCYPVRPQQVFAPIRAVFTDQFGPVQALVTNITRLCNPATKLMIDRPYKIIDANLHLTCYAIRPVHYVVRQVRTTDQFGTRVLTVMPPTEVCLPAAKMLWPPPKG